MLGELLQQLTFPSDGNILKGFIMPNINNTQKSLKETEVAIIAKIHEYYNLADDASYTIIETSKNVRRVALGGDSTQAQQILFIEGAGGNWGRYYVYTSACDGSMDAYKYPIYVITKEKDVYGYTIHPEHGEKLTKIRKDVMRGFLQKSNIPDFGDDASIDLLLATDIERLCTFEYLGLCEGYNRPDIKLGSCMAGKGNYFEPFNKIAKYLTCSYKGKVIARCIVWNDGIVMNGGTWETLPGRYADRLYYEEGNHRDILMNYLKKEGITPLWGSDNKGGFEYQQYCIEATKELIEAIEGYAPVAWMDTFSHFNTDENILYSFDWRAEGYNASDLHLDENTIVFLDQNGEYISTENQVYSNYEGRWLDRDYAVYVDSLDDWVSDDNDGFVYLEYRDETVGIEDCVDIDGEYYYEDDCIYSNVDGRYYVKDSQDYFEIDGGRDIAGVESENIAYVERWDEWLPVDKTFWSNTQEENIPCAEAAYSHILEDYVWADDLEELEKEYEEAGE